MSVICNICIDDTDLDLILSKISTLKTKIADWVDYQKNRDNLGRLGLLANMSASVELCNININSVIKIVNADEEAIYSLIDCINDLRANMNE